MAKKTANFIKRTTNYLGMIIYKNKNNELHRETGPSIIFADGTCCYYKNDQSHRTNGPSTILRNGALEYSQKNQLYRHKNLPQIIAQNNKQTLVKLNTRHPLGLVLKRAHAL